jgi:predicted small metal-binding protein
VRSSKLWILACLDPSGQRHMAHYSRNNCSGLSSHASCGLKGPRKSQSQERVLFILGSVWKRLHRLLLAPREGGEKREKNSSSEQYFVRRSRSRLELSQTRSYYGPLLVKCGWLVSVCEFILLALSNDEKWAKGFGGTHARQAHACHWSVSRCLISAVGQHLVYVVCSNL